MKFGRTKENKMNRVKKANKNKVFQRLKENLLFSHRSLALSLFFSILNIFAICTTVAHFFLP
jgi:hypothetical protein